MSIFDSKVINYTSIESKDVKHIKAGYFDEKIDSNVSEYLSKLIFLFKKDEYRVFLNFNLPDEDELENIIDNKNIWTFLFKYEEETKMLFFKKKIIYAVGCCESVESLTYFLKLIWNKCHESTVILILSKEIDKNSIKLSDSKKLAMNYPIVISRGHDGYCIDVFSKQYDLEYFSNKLKLLNERYELTTFYSETENF